MSEHQWEVSTRNGVVLLVVRDHIGGDTVRTVAIELHPAAITELVQALRVAQERALEKWPIKQRYGSG